MKKSDFFYSLPGNLIAQKPLAQRSASRLLQLDKCSGKLLDSHFSDFLTRLQKNDLVVFNNTKVIPARLFAYKSSGGKVEILIERIETNQLALAHIRASKAPKPGSLLMLSNASTCQVIEREQDLFRLHFNNCNDLLSLLNQIGHIPLPPYIARADDAEDLERYQTLFAKQAGAVAAPTAGLHFDQEALNFLDNAGVAKAYVTLHVGSGTFQPVREDNLENHIMHKEFYHVAEETVSAIQNTKANGGRVIAIGTTVVRALESAAATGKLVAGNGDTRLFITPGYHFKVVDAMLTNFHLPESTLLMLISAFAGYDHVMQAYQYAIQREYRFFSYGDAMAIF
jgi:S-adenosylmethionine:tRNA ribosyltransferase-isomerase